MAITQQLQSETTTSIGPATVTLSVTLGAGSNRLLLVCVLCDSFNNPEQGIPSAVTYSGIPLALVTDGTNVAQSVRSAAAGPTAGTTMAAFWYVLREAQLPANGAHNVSVTTVGTGGGIMRFVFGVWILTGCSQDTNVRSVRNASTDTPENLAAIGVILPASEPTDAILVAGINDTGTGTVQITIGGASLTEDFDVDQGGSSRAAAGTDLTAPLGPVGCGMTYTIAGTQRAAMSAIRIAEPFVLVGGQAQLSLENG